MKMARAAGTINCLAGLLVLVIVLISTSEAKVSISCPTVIAEIAPCASFMRESSSKKPSEACCNGVKILSGEAQSQKDRTDMCQCLKQGLATIGKYDPKRVSQIPKACGVPIKLPPIDQNTDCSKVIFTM